MIKNTAQRLLSVLPEKKLDDPEDFGPITTVKVTAFHKGNIVPAIKYHGSGFRSTPGRLAVVNRIMNSAFYQKKKVLKDNVLVSAEVQ